MFSCDVIWLKLISVLNRILILTFALFLPVLHSFSAVLITLFLSVSKGSLAREGESGVIPDPINAATGLSRVKVLFIGEGGDSRVGVLTVTPAIKRGILSWLLSMTGLWWREDRWLSSVWHLLRNRGLVSSGSTGDVSSRPTVSFNLEGSSYRPILTFSTPSSFLSCVTIVFTSGGLAFAVMFGWLGLSVNEKKMLPAEMGRGCPWWGLAIKLAFKPGSGLIRLLGEVWFGEEILKGKPKAVPSTKQPFSLSDGLSDRILLGSTIVLLMTFDPCLPCSFSINSRDFFSRFCRQTLSVCISSCICFSSADCLLITPGSSAEGVTGCSLDKMYGSVAPVGVMFAVSGTVKPFL